MTEDRSVAHTCHIDARHTPPETPSLLLSDEPGTLTIPTVIPVNDGTLYDLGNTGTNSFEYLTAVWIDGEMIYRGTERWNQVMSEHSATSSDKWIDLSISYTPHGDGLYIKESKMRRLYQVFIIDLRTDDVDEWLGVATSDRNAEFKAFAACEFDSSEIDNYQFVTKVLANVAERIEADE